VENKLKNISVIINKYRLHLLDLVLFANAGRMDQNTSHIFKTIFISIFTKLSRENSAFPVYISVYDYAVRDIKRSKKIFNRKISTKDLEKSINIEEFNHEEYIDSDISKALESIGKTERMILCLLIRHKLGIEELATLFSSTPGTILSKISKSRIELARAIISLNKNSKPKQTKTLNDCFYVRNMQTRHNYGLSSKEENSKINRHLQKCAACKNVYAWHQLISKLIEQVPAPSPDRQINADIFDKLSRRSFIPNLWYTIYKSWMVRTSILISAIILLITLLTSYYYDTYHHRYNSPVSKDNDTVVNEDIAQVQDNKLKTQTITSYKIKNTTRRRITITKNLNDLFKKIGAKMTDGTQNTSGESAFSKEMNGLTYFNVDIPKNSEEEFINSLKKIDQYFETTKHEETLYDSKPIETINLEIWVHRKNVR
jgi:hypothetical protein